MTTWELIVVGAAAGLAMAGVALFALTLMHRAQYDQSKEIAGGPADGMEFAGLVVTTVATLALSHLWVLLGMYVPAALTAAAGLYFVVKTARYQKRLAAPRDHGEVAG